MKFFLQLLCFFLCVVPLLLRADPEWLSVTLDNDAFLGNDSGYSNGLYFSWVNTSTGGKKLEPQSIVAPFIWGDHSDGVLATVTTNTIGQAINTPQDIKIENPDERELPYSGLLFLNNSYLSIRKNYADKWGTTIGIVGPSSGAEQTQKAIHSLIGSNEPKGWDTQLKDEPVFQLVRGRVWRYWESGNQEFDLLFNSEASLGTLSSAVTAGMTLRYGSGLAQSYSTLLLNSSRISNPVAINRGWYVYADINAGYIFNQIFADGNTFRDSRSVRYDHEKVGVSLGYAHSWGDLSITFAINDSNIIQSGSRRDELQELTRYGALTVAWRY